MVSDAQRKADLIIAVIEQIEDQGFVNMALEIRCSNAEPLPKIIKAVNRDHVFDELVKALRDLIDGCDGLRKEYLIKKAKRALAKASPQCEDDIERDRRLVG